MFVWGKVCVFFLTLTSSTLLIFLHFVIFIRLSICVYNFKQDLILSPFDRKHGMFVYFAEYSVNTDTVHAQKALQRCSAMFVQ